MIKPNIIRCRYHLTYQIPATTTGHVIEYWYDRISRNWIVQYKDEKDNQLGDADIVGTKANAIYAATQMSKEVRRLIS